MSAHKTLVLTGGTTGIGEATAKLFADHGCKVYNLDMQMPVNTHPSIETILCDTSKYEAVQAAFDKIMSHEQVLDHLFVNAGINVYGTSDQTPFMTGALISIDGGYVAQ